MDEENELGFTKKHKEKRDEEKVKLGTGDVQGPSLEIGEESGMLMGPGHPVFSRQRSHPDDPALPYPFPEGRLPSGAHPIGVRFDPITPFGEEFSGEPDNDELLPPPTRRTTANKRSPQFEPQLDPSFDPQFDPSGKAPFFK